MISMATTPSIQSKSLARQFLHASLPLRKRMGLTHWQIAASPFSLWCWKVIVRSHPLLMTTDLYPQETELLMKLFKESCPEAYLEVGVFWGGTFRKILKQRDDLSLPTKCLGLDIWDEVRDPTSNTHSSGCSSREAVRCALVKGGFKNFKLLSGSSSQVRDLVTCKIDFAFHDANHTYAAVKEDLEQLYPLMSDGATMAVHNAGREFEPDKSYYKTDGGPYQAVMDLVELGKWELKTLEYRLAVLKKLS
jgi:cephalosporin hydroxylase